MLINNIELSSLGIKLYDRVISSNQVSTKEAWLDGDIQPTYIRQQDSFKNIKLSFLVLAQDEDDAFLRISKLTNMLKKATLKFDDLDYYFDVSMIGSASPRRLKNGNFIVDYSFTSDYAKGEREVYTTDANYTSSFKLTLLYYQNSTTLLSTDSVTIRAAMFEDTNNTLASIGIETNKYRPNYYQEGIATNLGGREITYENLQSLGTLIINYAPIAYNLTINYYMDNGTGVYQDMFTNNIQFTYPQLQNIQSIGQLVDIKSYKPEGYLGRIAFTGALTVENLLAVSPIYVFYDRLENDLTKNVTVTYKKEDDNGSFSTVGATTKVFKQSDFTDGMTLGEILNVNAYRPTATYYNEGYIEDHSATELVDYDGVESSYEIKYAKSTNIVFVEYYIGVYPGWYRLSTTTLSTVYKESYEESFDLSDINLDLNKYHTSEYQNGVLYNSSIYDSYDAVISSGVLQVYYEPIDYTIQVQYHVPDEEPVVTELTINALDFIGDPVLSDIIPISSYRPEGFQFDALLSYDGPVTLAGLTQASPILIYFEEIVAARTKNIILKYKQELSSTFATINTSIITINEADTINGIRLKDVFNMNLYKPDYYENGILDGYSSTALLTFDEIESNYTVVYMASTFITPVRYYTDDVDDLNWIGSSSISYKVIDFTVDTTLYDLGFNINAYKPSYCDDGELQYHGPVNFESLRNLTSLNVVYETVMEPGGDLDYPHRFLFLEHNDLGDYESLHPNWTMNHAYINTGVSVEDMSKLTVVMECERVDEDAPLHNVNAGYGYLFGSSSILGSYFMRFNNQTQYGENLTGVNTYEAKAGLYSDTLVQTEDAAIGFSANSGIYAIERPGYSTAVFTYSNTMASEAAQMPYPLYLFANNNGGTYEDGLAGIGIYSCRIYYNGTLIRDYIPVQFYDKIGDQVAPSNCLYDKITGTFFEDATGQNSFNIRDDERYTDTNLDHKIGHCYVNYYKGETFMQSVAYYFRASDFVDQIFDPYEKFQIDLYQPSYYKPGEIVDASTLVWDFDNMNNAVYTVVYPEQANTITVKYYTENNVGVRTLIEEETIGISERDFYQAPTFGDIVRINKYKPEGFETDFEYPGTKVSLTRVVDHSPYEIVYKAADRELETYTTIIRYIKKVYGIRTYETIASEVLTFDETQFRDGEYIDFYINKNLHKPANYYKDGEPYQWYEMDERIDNPSKLKEMYTIVYLVDTVYLDVNYYKNSVNTENLIASTTWGINIDDFEPGVAIYILDTIPNGYVNKYKPANCNGGQIQNSSTSYSTFADLAAIEEVAIVYEEMTQPHDPESLSYEQKVLYWGEVNDEDYFNDIHGSDRFYGGKIPYIDLGYKPKDISRLRVELKGYARPWGIGTNTAQYMYQDFAYTYFFGYYGALGEAYLGTEEGDRGGISISASANGTPRGSAISPSSSGCFAFRCRVPEAGGYVYTAAGPQTIDGQAYYRAGDAATVISGQPKLRFTGIQAVYRKGKYSDYDDNYNVIKAYSNYGFTRTDEENINSYYVTDVESQILKNLPECDHIPNWCINRATGGTTRQRTACGNPYTMILDAYNSYGSEWRDGDSNTPTVYNFDESEDNPLFENICQPKGTLSLFQTTNPDTGNVNIMPFNPTVMPYLGVSGSMNLSSHALGNPYDHDFSTSVTTTSLVMTGTDGSGQPIFETKSQTRNILYASFQAPAFPQMTGCAIWGIKIYDQDRLVRNLIPVAEGDQIYDYVMPANGLFDLVTEIFFGNSNKGGSYTYDSYLGPQTSAVHVVQNIEANEVLPLNCIPDPTIYGKTVANYYDYDNSFITNQFVNVPTWYNESNEEIEDILQFNDYKPDDFHLDGLLDLDTDLSFQNMTLANIYEMGAMNIYYKLRNFTKTVVYYKDNVRVGSRDIFYSLEDIQNATSLDDLGIDVDLFYDEDFAHGRLVFDESIIENDDIEAFIDAPSPIVVYDKLTKQEAPNLLYVEYYRQGAYDDTLITVNEDSPNYLDCDLDAVVLNPNGAIKYYNHYHTALYEDEDYDYFIPYQVYVRNKFAGIHRGPARKFPTLAMIIENDNYTITEERNGWGRLDEYQAGWILLNQTDPVTGPGQNPDYDVADQETATIPFGSEITITKMTIDRLWCYCPAQDSWIKNEDISFNQAGKLYNGLGIDVIHLDEVDFSDPTLSSVGIYPQQYKLRFHNQASVPELTLSYANLSDLHEIEFVYPETIYSYTCKYYQYQTIPVNLLGTAAFTCSISDWNPDWDKFIETSWQQEEQIDYGYLKTRKTVDPHYLVIYSEPDDSSQSVTNYDCDGKTVLRITGEMTQQFYPVQDCNDTTIVGYVRALDTAYYELISEYGGTITVDIEPTLYRDTELTLTWDYFGFDKNLYKPLGFGDGVYLWNPRPWNKDNIKFTFNELVRCGTQYVVYPPFDPNTYKLWNQPNYLGTYYTIHYTGGSNETHYIKNRGISINMAGTYNYFEPGEYTEHPIYDIYTSGEITKAFVKTSDTLDTSEDSYYYSKSWNGSFYWLTDLYNEAANTHVTGYIPPYIKTWDTRGGNIQTLLDNPEVGDSYFYTFSNFRSSPTLVLGIGNEYLNKEPRYYLLKDQAQSMYDSDWLRMYDNTNLKGYALGRGSADRYLMTADPYSNSVIGGSDDYQHLSGIIYDNIAYENFMMIHYWVPVPKGVRYNWNGQEERMPDNGLFDLLTGDFARSYRLTDGAIKPSSSYSGTLQPTRDGKDLIFLRNQEINENNAYNYFANKEFEYETINSIYKISTDTQTYNWPDTYADRVRTIRQNTIIPVLRYADPQSNLVSGSWLYTGDQWLPENNATIITSGYAVESISYTFEKQTIGIRSINGQIIRCEKDPYFQNVGSEIDYGTDPMVLTSYCTASYTNDGTPAAYFTGEGWIPYSNTHKRTVEDGTNYVVAVNTNYYQYPIEDNNYLIDQYHYGDRITAISVMYADHDWIYTGIGWLKKTANNLSIVE
jgi:hypothetical protein